MIMVEEFSEVSSFGIFGREKHEGDEHTLQEEGDTQRDMDGTEWRIFKPDRSRYYREGTPQSYKEDKVMQGSRYKL